MSTIQPSSTGQSIYTEVEEEHDWSISYTADPDSDSSVIAKFRYKPPFNHAEGPTALNQCPGWRSMIAYSELLSRSRLDLSYERTEEEVQDLGDCLNRMTAGPMGDFRVRLDKVTWTGTDYTLDITVKEPLLILIPDASTAPTDMPPSIPDVPVPREAPAALQTRVRQSWGGSVGREGRST
jgi:hypothetical protein